MSPSDIASLDVCKVHDRANENVIFIDHLDNDLSLPRDKTRVVFDLSHFILSNDWPLERVLSVIFDSLRAVIPFSRIGVALIDDEGMAVSHRVVSERSPILGEGFRAPLAGSSLGQIARSGMPRLIRDLTRYLKDHPHSTSTAKIVADGFRSSLTCPITCVGATVGFLFFTSELADDFSEADILLLSLEVAPLVATVMERTRFRDAGTVMHAAPVGDPVNAMEYEMASACRVQSHMNHLDADHVQGLDVAMNYCPASRVGGDIIDIIRRDEHSIIILLADAMGHGVDSAMIVSSVKGAFRVATRHTGSPDAVLSQLNVSLCGMVPLFPTTAVCCLIDLATNTAAIASAGHYLPVHYCAATGDAVEQGCPGLPLGIEQREQYPLKKFNVALSDKIVFYTDGVIDAFSPVHETYSRRRLIDVVRRHGHGCSQHMLDALWHDVQSHCGTRQPHDDMMIMVAGWPTAIATSA